MPMKTVIGLVVLILTVVGAAAGFYLTQMNQDVRQQASVGDYPPCASSACSSASTIGVSTCIGASGQIAFCCPAGQTIVNGVCTAGTFGTNPGTCSTPWTVTCADGTSNSADCTVQATFGGDYGKWSKEHCNNGHGGLPGQNGVPSACGGAAVQCRTYDCPNGMNYNGNECRLNSPTVLQNGTGCPAPASGCGQIDYDSVADGGTDNYCGHTLYTDGCGSGSSTPGGNTTDGNTPSDGYMDSVSCTTVTGWACDADDFGKSQQVTFWIGTTAPETQIGTMIASGDPVSQADLTAIAGFCGGNAQRRFTFTIPEQYRGQTDKKIWVKTEDGTILKESGENLSPCIGPACVSLTMSPATPKYGETVNLTCAQVAGATSYSFNVTADGNMISPTVTNNTATFNAIYTGSYQASCSIN